MAGDLRLPSGKVFDRQPSSRTYFSRVCNAAGYIRGRCPAEKSVRAEPDFISPDYELCRRPRGLPFPADSKIIVAGESRAPFTLARLDPDGGSVVLRTVNGASVATAEQHGSKIGEGQR